MTTTNNIPSKDRIAVHQAGHAVAQALVGRGQFTVSHVSIRSGHDTSWRGVPAVGDVSIDRETMLGLYEYGLVTLAGIAAEERYQQMTEPEEEPLVAISDLADWQQAAQVLETEARIRMVSMNIMQKLQGWFATPQVWQVVEELSKELLEKDSVEGAQLKTILAPLLQE